MCVSSVAERVRDSLQELMGITAGPGGAISPRQREPRRLWFKAPLSFALPLRATGQPYTTMDFAKILLIAAYCACATAFSPALPRRPAVHTLRAAAPPTMYDPVDTSSLNEGLSSAFSQGVEPLTSVVVEGLRQSGVALLATVISLAGAAFTLLIVTGGLKAVAADNKEAIESLMPPPTPPAPSPPPAPVVATPEAVTEEPVAEEPVVEEPVAEEEPIVQEPVAEEPVAADDKVEEEEEKEEEEEIVVAEEAMVEEAAAESAPVEEPEADEELATWPPPKWSSGKVVGERPTDDAVKETEPAKELETWPPAQWPPPKWPRK